MTLGLSSGQNIFSSLGVVSRETRNAYPVLSEELQIVREQAELGHLSLALHQFADRTNVGEIRNLSALLAQNEQLGADISTSLHEYAHHLRVTMRQRAEAQANRANFWMLFPTILCLVLPATLILVAPAFFEFTKGRDQLRELSNTNKSKLDLAKPLQSNTDRAGDANQIPLVPAR